MARTECPGLPASWLNGWLAAIGLLVLEPRLRLSWTSDPSPVAVLGVDGDILQVIFTQEGDQVIVLTSAGLQVFEAESANLRSQLRFPATAAARAPRDDILYLAGEAGVGSFTLDGTEVWFAPRVRARAVYPMDDYVAALVDDMTITIIRSDGAVLGDATTLAAIRGVAVAPGLNRLFAVNAERQLQAWQLPPVAVPPQG